MKKKTKRTGKKTTLRRTRRKKETERSQPEAAQKQHAMAWIRKKWVIVIMIAAAAAVAATCAGVQLHRYFSIPVSNTGIYEIKGVDVSSYQGKVNWRTMEQQDIAFAFIKATEGSSHVDRRFEENWNNVWKTNLRAGAYHFMSFDTPASRQADNFIRQVRKKKRMLPPVVDVELYGTYTTHHPDRQKVWSILDPLLKRLKQEYGMDPVIYTNTSLYRKYIQGRYKNEIWIADLTVQQPMSDGTKWTFCQYSIQGRMKGYSGGVKSIDLDVFYGNRMAFFRYP